MLGLIVVILVLLGADHLAAQAATPDPLAGESNISAGQRLTLQASSPTTYPVGFGVRDSGPITVTAQSAPPEQGPLTSLADQKLTKVSRDLQVLRQEYQTYLNQRDAGTLKPSNSLLSIIGNRVVVDAVASGDPAALLTDLEALGLQNATAYGRIVSGQLPIDAIDNLDALASLNFVWPAYSITNVGLVTSQGDAAMHSDDARVMWGVDGTGVTVGTLSDSFDCLGGAAGDVASGDLPAGIVVLDDAYCPKSDEGRAMMQIIADVAPGANLAFHTASGGIANFAQGIEDLAAAGSDVIVDDVLNPLEPFFQDGIVAQAVDNVVGMGVVYFSSAGNWGSDKSYEGPFSSANMGDPTFDTHDFDSGPGVDIFQSVTIPVGKKVQFMLQWDQPFFAVSGPPGSANDLDIFLVDDPPTTVLWSSEIRNVGGDPLEILSWTNPGPGTAFNIMIAKHVPSGGPEPGLMKYLAYGAVTINEYITANATIIGHANASGAAAVGASPYFLTPEFGVDPAVPESFSSSGGAPILFTTSGAPTFEIREQPRFVAPDNGNTTFFYPGYDPDGDGFPNFSGTSAAAPHAAAVAALLLEARTSLSPVQVYTFLENTALDMDSPYVPGFPDGADFQTGYGLINADAALALLNSSPEGFLVYLPVVLKN
jgi:hypothetical protein